MHRTDLSSGGVASSQTISKEHHDSSACSEIFTVPVCILARRVLAGGVYENICHQCGIKLQDGFMSGTYCALEKFHKAVNKKVKDTYTIPNRSGPTTRLAVQDRDNSCQFLNESRHTWSTMQHRIGHHRGHLLNAPEIPTQFDSQHGIWPAVELSDIKVSNANGGLVFSYTVPVEELLMRLLHHWHTNHLRRLEQAGNCSIQWQSGDSKLTITSRQRDDVRVFVSVFSQFYRVMSNKMLYRSLNGVLPAMQDMLHNLKFIHNLVVVISAFQVNNTVVHNALLYGTRLALLRAGIKLHQFLRQRKLSTRVQSLDLTGSRPSDSTTEKKAKPKKSSSVVEQHLGSKTLDAVSVPTCLPPVAVPVGAFSEVASPTDIRQGCVTEDNLSVTVTTTPAVVSEGAKGTSSYDCPICYESIPEGQECELPCCHKFCRECIEEAMQSNFRSRCPVCMVWYGVTVGNQPESGCMSVGRIAASLPGYDWCGTIVLRYVFDEGIQRKEHPHPGKSYAKADFTAFLPDYAEGEEVLDQLREAFRARSIFTIGRSVETGLDDQIVWSDIPHKTSFYNGPKNDGFPDQDYLARVKRILMAKGFY